LNIDCDIEEYTSLRDKSSNSTDLVYNWKPGTNIDDSC